MLQKQQKTKIFINYSKIEKRGAKGLQGERAPGGPVVEAYRREHGVCAGAGSGRRLAEVLREGKFPVPEERNRGFQLHLPVSLL